MAATDISKTVFSERLKAALKESNMSQAELSRRTNLAKSAISDYMNGKKAPSKASAETVAKALNTPLENLIGGAGEPAEECASSNNSALDAPAPAITGSIQADIHKVKIPEWLKETRKNKNMAMDAVTEKLKSFDIDITTITLQCYESGVKTPSAYTLLALCAIYDVEDIIAEMGSKVKEFSSYFTAQEQSHMKKYRDLDPHSKKVVDAILDIEYERTMQA